MLGYIIWCLDWLINAYIMVIVVWCLLSWFPNARGTRLGEIVDRLVEPYMRWFDFIPPLGGISFSPVVAIIVLYLVQDGLTFLSRLL
ncbi:YggT family protein [Limosilactobacillus sp.]|jgi:YggT family protein|uniref:YggT family protein n=1 Tax=Limosilactobacillus sp. TaxID=2773925 RepID=UPI0025BCB43B|nr:YggT family protein [Limosilactobacillus sp.]MCH3922506.1 YggT family protein [Limosilactobacillus sp.]MCH3927188.1 YggT family protein [Limosilactobacillus sp.]